MCTRCGSPGMAKSEVIDHQCWNGPVTTFWTIRWRRWDRRRLVQIDCFSLSRQRRTLIGTGCRVLRMVFVDCGVCIIWSVREQHCSQRRPRICSVVSTCPNCLLAVRDMSTARQTFFSHKQRLAAIDVPRCTISDCGAHGVWACTVLKYQRCHGCNTNSTAKLVWRPANVLRIAVWSKFTMACMTIDPCHA